MSDAATPEGGGLRRFLGTLLVRAVVPAWILAGAVMKLTTGTPGTLPKNFRTLSSETGISLQHMLAFFVAIEFLLAIVMIVSARLSRPLAGLTLLVFCGVLVGEMVAENSSCGCLGANSPPPRVMLLIDGALLLGVLLLPTMRPGEGYRESKRLGLGVALGGVVALATGGYLLTKEGGDAGERPGTTDPAAGTPTEAAGRVDPTVNPSPTPLPDWWFAQDLSAWIGRPWREVPLLRFMPTWPEGLDEGTRHVTWYSRTCDHCEEMFNVDLATDPGLAERTVAIAIPRPGGFPGSSESWPMPDTACTLMNLPVGPDWVIEPPLTIRIEDGIVRCATEGDHKECMRLP